MPIIVTVETDRFRDLLGRFASVRDSRAVEHAREHAHRAGRILSDALRQEAPSSRPDPLGRPKPPGYRKLRDNINAQVEMKGGPPPGFEIKMTAPPQVRFVLDGTPPHIIPRGGSAEQMARGYPLHFWWHKQNREAWFWSVNHPGTQPNRFDLRALRKVRERVLEEARRGAIAAFVQHVRDFWEE